MNVTGNQTNPVTERERAVMEMLKQTIREYKEFEVLVRDLRRAQKRYFANRNKDDLIEAKRLEEQIDDLLFT